MVFRHLKIFLLISCFLLTPVEAAVVTTFLGQTAASDNDGWATMAGLVAPAQILKLEDGSFLIVDQGSHNIKKFNNGRLEIFAGAGGASFTGTSGTSFSGASYLDGEATLARFSAPYGIVKNSKGEFFVSDQGNNCIRKIDKNGLVSTFAGTNQAGRVDGQGTNARFNGPTGMVIDSQDNIYVTDNRNHLIRKITPVGLVSSLAGSTSGFVDGTGNNAKFSFPQDLTLYNNILYVVDKNNKQIRSVTLTGTVTTILKDQLALNTPTAVVFDNDGNFYISDTGNHVIKRVSNQNVISTIAGTSGLLGLWNSTGDKARFNRPFTLFLDEKTLYVSDASNFQIRKIDLEKDVFDLNIQALTGKPRAGFTNGFQQDALLNTPTAAAYDSTGNLIIVDSNNHAIRKLSPQGELTTIAGTGARGFLDGPGLTALFSQPSGLAIDSSNNIYIADTANHRIRKIDTTGTVTTFAGTGVAGFLDGAGITAQFNSPIDLAIDPSGNLYVADQSNNRIRKIDVTGLVTTIAGGVRGGDKEGVVSFALLNQPSNITLDESGNIYVADRGNNKIKIVKTDGSVYTLAGMGSAGNLDGKGKYALLNNPSSLVVKNGLLYFTSNNRIKIFDLTTKEVKTLLGSGESGFSFERESRVAFKAPRDLLFDASNNLIVVDTNNHTITKVTINSQPYTHASFGSKDFYVVTKAGDGKADLSDGAAKYSNFSAPYDVAVNKDGKIYVVDRNNHVIRMIDGDEVSTIAGTGEGGFVDGTSLRAKFYYPEGIDIDRDGNLIVADTSNHRIRKVDLQSGQVSTIAGSGTAGYLDGAGINAMFNSPTDVKVAPDGSLLVADYSNHCIRKIDGSGLVSLFAGAARSSGYRDGKTAKFSSPASLAIDKKGNLFVTEATNHTVRKISPTGFVSTLAGSRGDSLSESKVGIEAQFNKPRGITVDDAGIVYVADSLNNRIRKILLDGSVETFAGYGLVDSADGRADQAAFSNPIGLTFFENKFYVADAGNNLIRLIQDNVSFISTEFGIEPNSKNQTGNQNSGPIIVTVKTPAPQIPPIVLVQDPNQNNSLPKDPVTKIVMVTLGADFILKASAFSFANSQGENNNDFVKTNTTWFSDQVGQFATGETANTKVLPLGNHIISAKTIDENGKGSEDRSENQFKLLIVPAGKGGYSGSSTGTVITNNLKQDAIVKIISPVGDNFFVNRSLTLKAVAFDLTSGNKDIPVENIQWTVTEVVDDKKLDFKTGTGNLLIKFPQAGVYEAIAKVTINGKDYFDTKLITIGNKKSKEKTQAQPKSFDESKTEDDKSSVRKNKPKTPSKQNPNGAPVVRTDVKIKLL